MLETFLNLMVIGGITGWWATRKMRQRMEKRLGRKVKGDRTDVHYFLDGNGPKR